MDSINDSDHFGGPKEVEGIDQHKAQSVWRKLEKNSLSPVQILVHADNTFIVVNSDEFLGIDGFNVCIFPPDYDRDKEIPQTVIVITQDGTGNFRIEHSINSNSETPFTKSEINTLLDKIIASGIKESEGSAENVVLEVRGKIK